MGRSAPSSSSQADDDDDDEADDGSGLTGPLAPGSAHVAWLFPQRQDARLPTADLAVLDRLVVSGWGSRLSQRTLLFFKKKLPFLKKSWTADLIRGRGIHIQQPISNVSRPVCLCSSTCSTAV